MRITMAATKRVSEDGWTDRLLHKGETYEVAEEAARSLLRQKLAAQEGCPQPIPPGSPFHFRF